MAKRKTKGPDATDLSRATPAEVVKAFAGQLQLLGTSEHHLNVKCLSTGLKSLDAAIGLTGVPLGRVIELFGPESVGKTAMALHIAGCAQRAGGKVAYVDAENAIDLDMAGWFVNVDDLMISQPDFGEQALDIVCDLTARKAADVIIVDSVSALVPQKELEEGGGGMAMQARMMSEYLRKIPGLAARAGTIIIFINQIRMKLNVRWGNPETTSGGQALKFYASLRIDVRKTATVKKGDKPVGIANRVKIVKNKVAAPFRECELVLVWGKGYQEKT